MAPNNSNCWECKLVTKDMFKCIKCKRLYHLACWPKKVVINKENKEFIGCTICVRDNEQNINAKKRRLNEMNVVNKMCKEETLK